VVNAHSTDMQRSFFNQLLIAALAGASAYSADKEALFTFYVAGIECAACVEVVRQSVAELEGVSKVELEQRLDSVANVTFDPERVSAQQVAQAVTDAVQIHGRPYEAWMQLRVPDYAKGGNAAKVDAVIARMKAWVDVVVMDRDQGDFLVHFQPLKTDPKRQGAQGWNPGQLEKALKSPVPEGLGLDCSWVTEAL
jgi:copper chaperone CopZ